MGTMRRREFLSVLAGTAAWPIAARAQQPAIPVIGFLHQGSPDQNIERLATFRKGLGQAGFVEGQNITIEFRWADGQVDRLPALAADLVQRQVALIATPFSTDAALAAKAATKAIPVVFVSSADPVQIGLVASLNRPGGNITGVTTLNTELAPKRLELLRNLVPNASRYFALINPTSNLAGAFIKDLETAAAILGIRIDFLRASNDRELETAFASIPQQSGSVLISSTDAFFFVRREQIATLAIRHGLPAIFDARVYTMAGGLMSYAGDDTDMMLLTVSYIGRILRGERPADLPVAQPTKFALTINLKTAKALGLNVPPALLATADEVIE
jgi:putative tryptophan/tyrosine transport system substrate-binding protein